MKRCNLKAIQARNLPRLNWRDVPQIQSLDSMSDADEKVLTEYFKRFASIPDGKCPGCNEHIMQFFRWEIVHGEGHCSNCGYPARAYHYDIGPIKKLDVVLPWHPDELKQRKTV